MKIRLHPATALMIGAAALTGQLENLALAFACVSLHELGHWAAARACGCRVTALEILPFGCALQVQGALEALGAVEALVALAGPGANAIALGLLSFARHFLPWEIPYISQLEALHRNMLAFNLLPLLPLDGGRVLRCLLARVLGLLRATRALAWFSLGVSLLMLALFLLSGRWLPAGMALFLAGLALREKRNAHWVWLKEITDKKSRLMRERAMSVRQVAARGDMTLGQLTRGFAPNYYHLVLVLDERFAPVATLGENQVVDALMKWGAGRPVRTLVP